MSRAEEAVQAIDALYQDRAATMKSRAGGSTANWKLVEYI